MADRFDRAVLRQQPTAVIGAIDHDFIKLFAFTRGTAPGDMPISRWQFQTTYPTYPPLITVRYVASIRPGGGQPSVIRPLAAVLRDYQLHGGYTPGGPCSRWPPLAGPGPGATCSAYYGPDSGRICSRQATATACLLTTATAIILLLASDVYEFSWRYQLPALVLLPPRASSERPPLSPPCALLRRGEQAKASEPDDLPVRRDGLHPRRNAR